MLSIIFVFNTYNLINPENLINAIENLTTERNKIKMLITYKIEEETDNG